MDNRDSFSHNLKHLFLSIPGTSVSICSTDDFNKSDLEFIDALVLSPGPGLPDDHTNLKLAIDQTVGLKPIFGVCLGLQAIVEYFGGHLFRLAQVAHGIKSPLTILDHSGLWKGIGGQPLVGRYHSYMADIKSLPEQLIVTSCDIRGRPMSLRHRMHPVFAVQFHPESYMTNEGVAVANNFCNYIR